MLSDCQGATDQPITVHTVRAVGGGVLVTVLFVFQPAQTNIPSPLVKNNGILSAKG